jgi:hypothetical protein
MMRKATGVIMVTGLHMSIGYMIVVKDNKAGINKFSRLYFFIL